MTPGRCTVLDVSSLGLVPELVVAPVNSSGGGGLSQAVVSPR